MDEKADIKLKLYTLRIKGEKFHYTEFCCAFLAIAPKACSTPTKI